MLRDHATEARPPQDPTRSPSPVPLPPAGGPRPRTDASLSPDRTGFWLYAAHLLTLWSIALSNIALSLALLASPRALRRSLPSWATAAPAVLPLGAYVLFLMGSIAASPDVRTSLRGATEVFNLASLPLALLLVRGERDVRRLVDALVGVGALLAGSGLVQYLLGYGDIDRRIRGPFSHYMTFAGFLLICDLLLLASMFCAGGWRSRWRWLALLLINTALAGSYTRSAWVGLALALTVLVVARAPRLLAAYPAAALLFVLLAPVPLLQRVGSIFDLRDTSNYDRLCMLEAGLDMIAERPLFGLGPELVERWYPIYRPPSAPRYTVPHLHNSFLQLAAERGLPALAAYLAMTGASLWLAVRRFRREGGMAGRRADLHLGVVLSLIAFNLAGLFENNWGDTEVQRAILFVLAVPFCLALGDAGVREGDV